jgi:hypothetical protein
MILVTGALLVCHIGLQLGAYSSFTDLRAPSMITYTDFFPIVGGRRTAAYEL